MQDAKVEARIRRKYRLVAIELDERRRRQWAAVEAQEIGWGGISLVSRATGLSRPTIMAGIEDLQEYGQIGRGIDETASPRFGSHRRSAVEAERLQPASQP